MLGASPRPLTHFGLCQDSQDSQNIVAIIPTMYYNDTIRSHSTSISGKDTLGRVWRNLPMGFVQFPCRPRTGTPGVLPFLTVKTQWHICNVSLREAHLRLRVQDFYWELVMQAFPKPQNLRRKRGVQCSTWAKPPCQCRELSVSEWGTLHKPSSQVPAKGATFQASPSKYISLQC